MTLALVPRPRRFCAVLTPLVLAELLSSLLCSTQQRLAIASNERLAGIVGLQIIPEATIRAPADAMAPVNLLFSVAEQGTSGESRSFLISIELAGGGI